MLVGLNWNSTRLKFLAPVVLFLLTLGAMETYAQTPVARKFAEIGNERTSDIMARLALFATSLRKENAKGLIIGHRSGDTRPGAFRREIYGYRDYLINALGLESNSLEVVEGELTDRASVELWILPGGAKPPKTVSASSLQSHLPTHFDKLWFGAGCVSEYSLVQEQPEDALRIFSQVLGNYPGIKGFVLVNPSANVSPADARELLRTSVEFLEKSGISPNRILASVESSRRCAQLNLWMTSANTVVPKNKLRSFFQSQLALEAERQRYSIRRVEFLGNDYTRDNILRLRVPGLQEGVVFTRAILASNLASLSRLKIIRPVQTEAVDLDLDPRNRLIDIMIEVIERRASRR